MTLADIQALHEPYAYLYVGDYFADTLDLSVREHRALRLLLLETWVRGPVGNVRLAQAAGLTRAEWQEVKPAVLPLLPRFSPTSLSASRIFVPLTGSGCLPMTGTSSAASCWSATDMPASIAALTSRWKATISSP
jgi:hypothetical protein